MLYVGSGVSGGEEGALTGPSLMPGGSAAAWPHIKPIFQAVCARTPDGEPCCDWMGEDGAGHFVKMVHNGIEYGDMQLIAETYDVMKRVLGMSNAQMHEVFAGWNARELDSYLIEITRDILAYKRSRRADHRRDPRCRRPERYGQVDGDRGARPGHAVDADRRGGVRALAVGSKEERVVASKQISTRAAGSRRATRWSTICGRRCTRRRSSATRRDIGCCARRRRRTSGISTTAASRSYGAAAASSARRSSATSRRRSIASPGS